MPQQSWRRHLFHYAIPLHLLANYHSNIKVHTCSIYNFNLLIFNQPDALCSCFTECPHIWVYCECKILNFCFQSIWCLLCPSINESAKPQEMFSYALQWVGAFWGAGVRICETEKAKTAFSVTDIKIPADLMEPGLCSPRSHFLMKLLCLQWDHIWRASDGSNRAGH